jgi:hypothetical protein
MSSFVRNWSLETMEEHLDHLHESVQTETETAHLAAPILDTKSMLTAFNEESRTLHKQQNSFACKLAAADRRLDLRTSVLSSQARQIERINPTQLILRALFPEGVTPVTKYRGRGVATQIRITHGVIEVIKQMPEAAPLMAAATEVETAANDAEAILTQLTAIDDQIENRAARAEELANRAYQTYYATKNELLKIYHNNKRLVNTFFLE